MQRARLFLVLAAVLVTLSACSGGDDGGDGGGGGAGTETDSAGGGYGAPADAGSEGGAAGQITASGNAFAPGELQLTAGETTTITVENADGALHSFTFDEAGVDQDIEGGASAEVEVTAPDAGDYTFYCKYHSGMEGTVTVA